MRCAIMQPTYLPWTGYFNLMASVDLFIFLDDVQLQKNSWHNRNRILLKKQPHWITVPVQHVRLDQLLSETLLCEDKQWRRKHRSLLLQTYARHPYIEIVEEITNFIQQSLDYNLAELNIKIICYIAKKLEIQTPVKYASELSINGTRTERLLNLLKIVKATEYLSPIGSAVYLANDCFTEQENIQLQFQKFEPKLYNQKGTKEYIPFLSIIDTLANIGWENTAHYIRN